MGGPGSGAKPKMYPDDMVMSVRDMYQRNMTQSEIAKALNTTQKVIWNLMRRHGIVARVAAKRDQYGPNNSSWKGDMAGYAALHLRVEAQRGAPSLCEVCGTTSAKKFEWANLTGRYEDVSDYRRMCSSCHAKFDHKSRNLGAYAERKDCRP